MVGGRREQNVRSSTLRSVIAAAIGIGVGGCIFAILHHAFFSASRPADRNLPLSKPNLEVNSLSCESMETVNLLRKQVKELNEMLRMASREKGRARKAIVPGESVNPRLAKILSRVAVGNELIVALANSNVKEMLEIWFTSIKKVGIPNYLVVALDDATVDFCRSNDVPVYQRDPDEAIDSVGRTGGNHAVSALKFRILREFLQLGYNVLLSDADVVYLQNPFDHLYRDSDVESMSDGHDNSTAYGYDDVFDDPAMGWSRYAYTTRLWAYNSGFFYIRATVPAMELLDRVSDSLARRPGAWDQAVYNEELFLPSRPGYVGLHAAKRTMDIYQFMNSKMLFKTVRGDDNLRKLRPVVVHVNYHPDKLPRMRAVFEFYVNGKKDALEPFTDGTDW